MQTLGADHTKTLETLRQRIKRLKIVGCVGVAAAMGVLLGGCSTKKNTWLSRNYQAMVTRYNVYFNAKQSYKEGLVRIEEAHTDDYGSVLPMYAASKHENLSAGQASMSRAVEKTQKAIKKHSIRKRPKKKQGKVKDEKYQSFLRQEEYNPMMSKTWMLMGKAQFHEGEFLQAVGTFSYVIKHFGEDTDAVSQAKVWLARTYGEMGWLYEGEDVLSKVNADGFSPRESTTFAAFNADLMMKEQRWDEAIPYLEMAVKGEKRKKQKVRFKYILAQLYAMQGDDDKAYQLYKEVQRSNVSFEMSFNAMMRQAETAGETNRSEMRRLLNKMARTPRNQDYLDQIYTAMGHLDLAERDTAAAIGHYKEAAEKSVRNGYEKAAALIALGDVYYQREQYREAYPAYREGVMLMNAASDDFGRINKRAELLGDLERNLAEVELQDSLQRLSRLPEKEQDAEIAKIINRVKAEEAAEKARQAEEERLAQARYGDGSTYAQTSSMLQQMGNTGSAFYFYNVQLMAAGKADFVKRWGNRRLEDNWRRAVKTNVAWEDDDEDDEDEDDEEVEIDSTMDVHSPAYYKKQLYTTDEQYAASDDAIKNALMEAGWIYGEQIENLRLAEETFAELERRFPTYEKLPDAYYFLYRQHQKAGDDTRAENDRRRIVEGFPDSRYAKILGQPDYEAKLEAMGREQDSLYEKAYYAYMESDYATVRQAVDYMEKTYPASGLMPKFMYLRAMSLARSGTKAEFTGALEDLVAQYPNTDVAAMSKELLAMLAQGKENQRGASEGALSALREELNIEETEEDLKGKEFTADPTEKHYVVFVLPEGADANKWQFDVAAYNFSKFLIKDFDLEKRAYDDTRTLLGVKPMESLAEARWYADGIVSDKYFEQKLQKDGVEWLIVSESNYKLMFYPFSLEEYKAFYGKNISGKDLTKIAERAKQSEAVKAAEAENARRAEAERQAEEARKAAENQAVEENVKPEETPAAQPMEPAAEKTETPADVAPAETKKTEDKSTETQPVAETPETTKPATPTTTPTTPPRDMPVEKRELPKYKGLYTYDTKAKYDFVLYVARGGERAQEVADAIETWNNQNYPVMNLKTTVERADGIVMVKVESLPYLMAARAYMMKIVKERSLFEPLAGGDYKNLIITEENLEVLKKSKNIGVYMEFMRLKILR